MVRETVESESLWIGKGLWRKWFAEEPSLKFRWKTKRVREDASGDREDGEEDDDANEHDKRRPVMHFNVWNTGESKTT